LVDRRGIRYAPMPRLPFRRTFPARRSAKPTRRRALELLADCGHEGCTRGGAARERHHDRDHGRACPRRARHRDSAMEPHGWQGGRPRCGSRTRGEWRSGKAPHWSAGSEVGREMEDLLRTRDMSLNANVGHPAFRRHRKKGYDPSLPEHVNACEFCRPVG
jgi:hypothetical protein